LNGVFALERDVQRSHEAHRAREAEEARLRDARLAKQMEAARAEDWRKRSEIARQRVQEAATAAAARKWTEAGNLLYLARTHVEQFRGTTQEGSPEWQSLARKIDELRARLDPELERIRAEEEAKERRRAAVEEAKQRQLEAAEESRRKREEAREASPLVMYCRDGTTSSCSCTGSRRGCCSHHKGIAGCR
jgi:hypothetical protein